MQGIPRQTKQDNNTQNEARCRSRCKTREQTQGPEDLRTDVHTIIMIKEPQISAERVKKSPENHVNLQCPKADESQDITCTVSTNADLEPTMTDNLDMPKFTAEK